MIRSGKFGDIPAITRVLKDLHATSVYSGLGFDEKECKSILMQSMQRQGLASEGGTFVAVSEYGGEVNAFIVAILQRVYHISTDLMATDLFTVSTEGAGPEDASRLVAAMKKWAWRSGAVEVQIGATQILGRDASPVARWLKADGMKRFGEIYRQENPNK